MQTKRLYILLPWVYLTTVVVLLVLPTREGLQLDRYWLGIRTDHMIHALLFFPAALVFYARAVVLKRELRLGKSLLVGIIFCAACETLHLVLPYRTFDPDDFVANTVGMFLGFLVMLTKPAYAYLRQLP